MNLDNFVTQQGKRGLQKFLSQKLGVHNLNFRAVREGKIDSIPFAVVEFFQNHHIACIGYFFKKSHIKLTLRYKNLLFLRKHGFSKGKLLVPKPLYFKHNIFLRTKADGKNFGHEAQKNPKILFEVLPRISSWLKKLHATPLKGYKEFNVFKDDINKYQSYCRSIAGLRLMNPDALQRIQKKLLSAEKTAKAAFIHNDLHLENIFYDKNLITVIDFDSSGKGDCLMDIGYFLSQVRYRFLIQKNLLSQPQFDRLRNEFICLYFKNQKPPANDLKKIALYETRSDFRLLGFLAKFIIPNSTGAQKEKAFKNAEKLIKLMHDL